MSVGWARSATGAFELWCSPVWEYHHAVSSVWYHHAQLQRERRRIRVRRLAGRSCFCWVCHWQALVSKQAILVLMQICFDRLDGRATVWDTQSRTLKKVLVDKRTGRSSKGLDEVSLSLSLSLFLSLSLSQGTGKDINTFL